MPPPHDPRNTIEPLTSYLINLPHLGVNTSPIHMVTVRSDDRWPAPVTPGFLHVPGCKAMCNNQTRLWGMTLL